MPTKTLKAVLALCAALALSPFLPWMLAGVFESIADGWLGGLAVTVPLGLGLAAVALAAHGLLLHGELADTLERNFAGAGQGSTWPAEQALVPAGGVAPVAEASPAAARATAEASLPAAEGAGANGSAGSGGGRTADLGGKAKEKVGLAGKQAGGRVVGRAKSKAKGTVQRNVRDALRGLRPGR